MDNALKTVLRVENLRLRAQHGWYATERRIGGFYRFDIEMRSAVADSEAFHDLSETVNYELIYHKVKEVMQEEFHLIEEACKAVFDALMSLDGEHSWKVRITKEHPPMRSVGATSFELCN